MKRKRRIGEQLVWAALAFAGGIVPGMIDLQPGGAQGPALALMLVNFTLTLPGRASVWLIAVASWLAMPATAAVAHHAINPGVVIALVPALIAGAGGMLFGGILDSAASQLTSAPADPAAPWHQRALPTRFLLAVSLTAIAALGVPLLSRVVRPLGLRAPVDWQVMVWMIMTLLGWIALAPLILGRRGVLRFDDGVPGVRAPELAVHVVVVVALAALHVVIVLGISAILLIPVLDQRNALATALFTAFLPLDSLAYLTILALGYASDVERLRREGERRETALFAEALDNRLSALRARLNPHFLFNALNSVAVLARSNRSQDAAGVVDGMTSLLRYVLDERRDKVPLRDELEFARRYLEVQRVRFGTRLAFDVSSTPDADTSLVPQLLLQPIVENAVEHGIAKTLDGGTVRVAARLDGNEVHVSVSDDGAGWGGEGEGGIGLASTRERLAHLYGERARIDIGEGEGSGTRVEITLPREQ